MWSAQRRERHQHGHRPYLVAGRLDASFPLPLDAPFTARAAVGAGVRPTELRALVDAGLLVRPVLGVYRDADLPDSPRLRADCLRLVVPSDCVVVDRHAGWLHGAPMILAPGEHLGLRPLSLFRPSGQGRLRNELCASGERNLSRSDVVELEGIPVTTPLRTACDLGRVRWPAEAISGGSMMLRLGGFDQAAVIRESTRFRRMRWVTTLRAIAPMASPLHESPPEAVLHLRCYEAGLVLQPQLEVAGPDGRFVARLDLGCSTLRVGVEYDGDEWHRTQSQRERDRSRRADAQDVSGTARSRNASGTAHDGRTPRTRATSSRPSAHATSSGRPRTRTVA